MNRYDISTERARLQLDVIHAYLTMAYWCEGIPRAVVARSMEHSLCFGVYRGDEQVGFARVVTDYATYGYIADVFILEAHRGRGLSKRLMAAIMEHPELQGLRRWALVTRDAHGLYRQFGFDALARPGRHMEIVHADIYKHPPQAHRGTEKK
jgi:GNAT superfamily N-acetyltransferase